MATWNIHTDVTKSFGFLALLTDGSLLINEVNSKKWWKLTPDATGSYLAGTYSAIADSNHWQFGLAPCVQADGTLLLAGGEFSGNVNGVNSDPASKYTQRYDPATNTWSGDLGAPTGWAAISDASCSLLPDNRFFIGYVQQVIGSGNDYAVLEGNTWTVLYAPGPAVVSDEGVIGLLQDGTLLCVPATGAPATFKWVPSTSTWVSAGNSPAIVGGAEVGPMVVLPDGRALISNSNQTGSSSLYTQGALPTDPGSWASAANMGVDGSGASWWQDDLPSVLLPSGQVLARVKSTTPSIAYLLYDPTGDTWTPTVTPGNDNTTIGGGRVRMIVLPNGQIAQTTAGNTIAFYTPDGAASPAWKPTITGFPQVMHPGDTYTIEGTQFNGLSQTVAPADDGTIATNYPLVRATDLNSGAVAYWRTQDHSTMGIATGSAIVSTRVTIPATALGRFSLVVMANGIASDAVTVVVERPIVQVLRATASALFRIGVNQQTAPQFSNDGLAAIGAYAADGVTRATVSGADPVGPNDFTTRQYVTLQNVLLAGNATGGRDIILTSGDAIRGVPGITAGPVTLAGGYATEGDGGDVFITGSDGVGLAAPHRGGNVTIVGGRSTPSGHAGNIVITGGQAVTGTNAGTITITGGAGGSFSGAGGAATLAGGTASGGNSVGGAASVLGGGGHGTQVGGVASLVSGGGGATGAGATTRVTGGAGGATSGAAGGVTIAGGVPIDGDGGGITVTASAGVGVDRNGGAIAFTAGNGTGAGSGGAITISAGQTDTGLAGNVIIAGGAGGTASGNGGQVNIQGGAGTTASGGPIFLGGGIGAGGSAGATATLTGGTGGVTGAGGATTVRGGAGGGTSGAGGALNLQGGIPTDGNGGTVSITGRSAATLTSTNRNGGGVTITAGAATVGGTAGSISLTAGQSASGPAGTISITAGAGGTTSGNGGTVTVKGGAGTAANANGGAVTFTGGAGQGSGQGGVASLVSGAGGAIGTGAFTLVTGGAGGATSGAAGGVTIAGGIPVDGDGGPITITGSAGVGANRNGSDVTLQPGAKTGAGVDGTVVLKDSGGTAQLTIATTGVTLDQIATAGIVLVSAAGLLSQGLLQLWCWGASASNSTGALTYLNAAASASAQTGVVGNGEIVQGAAAFTATRITISLSSAYATDTSTWEVYLDGVASGFKVTIGTGVTSGTATGTLAIAANKRVSIGCTQTGTENVAVKPRCSVWGYPA